MHYLPIEEHGIIGDMHTAALVGSDGTIDWLCFPTFDSPSVFGSILDAGKGGYFRIAPLQDGVRYKQLYHPETNVLITRFLSPDGVGEHWKQAVESWQDLEKWMEWSAKCNVSTLHNGTIVQAHW